MPMERQKNHTCELSDDKAEYLPALRQSLSVPDRSRSNAPPNRSPADLTAGGMPRENVTSSLQSPREAAAEFISNAYPWQIMLTVTNSPYGGELVTATAPGCRESKPHFVSEGSADKRFNNGMNKLNRMIFGQRYYKSPTRQLIFAATLEFQKSGNPHHHALIYTQYWEQISTQLEQKQFGKKTLFPQIEEVFRQSGAGPIIRAELVRTPDQASRYITKACRYMAKTDGLTYGGPWRKR